MARRLPSTPPVLPGFSHVHILGTGGFADVFLYEQNMPRRQVAVKVMLNEVVNNSVRQMFQAEANLMAKLSTHPSILTVYQAGVSADGRPYLVMELCSSALSERYRLDRIPVPDVLRIAVRIGSAIESAHREGVLHRDIKPSNILTTAYGHPVLSDFGIASTLSDSGHLDAIGMSIPWSAPEVLLDETAGTVASEVWSLGATVFSLLAGRSPFELTDGSNQPEELIGRIAKAKPQPINREDVPASLERLLAEAMARRPHNRPHTILELVRGFQAVEAELGLPQTPLEVAVDEWASATIGDLEERTRVRVSHSPAAQHSPRQRRRLAADTNGAPAGIGTVHRDGSAPSGGVSTKTKLPRFTMNAFTWTLIVSAVLVIALGTISTIVLVRSLADQIPRVTDIDARVVGGQVEFSWGDPGLDRGDAYQVSTDNGFNSSIQSSRTFTVAAAEGDRVCLTVTVNRNGQTGTPSNRKCVDVNG